MGWANSRVVLGVLAYWLTLLAVSFNPFGSSLIDSAMPLVVLAGFPLLGFAGWSIRRMGRLDMDGLAYSDELTGVRNRRAFMLRLRSMLREAGPGSLGLVLLDVDGLKGLNDRCGHQAGDELLAHAAHNLARGPGELFRIGGDEFAVLVDRSRGETVSQVLRQLTPVPGNFVSCGHEHEIRVSYGYASNTKGMSEEALFRLADLRLRELKRQLYSDGKLPERRELADGHAAGRSQRDLPGVEGMAPVLSLEARRHRLGTRQTG